MSLGSRGRESGAVEARGAVNAGGGHQGVRDQGGQLRLTHANIVTAVTCARGLQLAVYHNEVLLILFKLLTSTFKL